MKSFIFITIEGTTFQPESDNIEPDIENSQVIGFATGSNEEDAFQQLINENKYLIDTHFNDITCLELKELEYFEKSKKFFICD